MTPDSELLRQYAERHDEAAFAEVVRRQVDLVYSVARRQANGDAQLAEDVTQTVFTDLARKARLLCQRETLAGWLHTSARFAASKAIRGEQRRRAREQEATAMHETITTEINWESLRPLLDESVGRLNETDRDAIVLRFYQGKSHQEIGAILGLSENSANKRIERALEKLRGYFAQRGVTTTSAILATAISANSVQAAPAGLAEKVRIASLAIPASAGLSGAILAAIIFMNNKIKIALALVIMLAGLVIFVVNRQASNATTLASNQQKIPGVVPKTSTNTVAMPALAPAVPSASTTNIIVASPTTNPRTDIQTATVEFLRVAEAQDLVGIMQFMLTPNAIQANMKSDHVSTIEEEALLSYHQQDNPQQSLESLIQALRSIQGQLPEMDETGTHAVFKLDPSVTGPKALRFNKKDDGLWYMN